MKRPAWTRRPSWTGWGPGRGPACPSGQSTPQQQALLSLHHHHKHHQQRKQLLGWRPRHVVAIRRILLFSQEGWGQMQCVVVPLSRTLSPHTLSLSLSWLHSTHYSLMLWFKAFLSVAPTREFFSFSLSLSPFLKYFFRAKTWVWTFFFLSLTIVFVSEINLIQ